MSRSRRLNLGLGAALAIGFFFVAGCSEFPTVADSPAGTTVSLKQNKESKERELELKAWEEREKDRVKLAQELSKPVYDSLKLVWEKFLKGNPQNTVLLMCDPLQYTADVKIMGPEGGDMSIGPHKLSIPKGALTEHTVITGELPVSTEVTVKLSPHGTQFVKDVKLTLSYKHCFRPKWLLEQIVYVDEAMNILEYPYSVDYTNYEYVTGWIRHFSRYAVAF